MKLYIIESKHVAFAHLSKSFDAPKALCRKNPFPEHWDVMVARSKPTCPNCRTKGGI